MNKLKHTIIPVILGIIVGKFSSNPYVILFGIVLIVLLYAFLKFILRFRK